MSTELSTSLAEIIRSQEIFSDDRAVKTSSEEFRRRDSALRRLGGCWTNTFERMNSRSTEKFLSSVLGEEWALRAQSLG